MHEVGHSINDYSSLVKRLSVRARIPGDSRLTEIEDQFMKIIALGTTNPISADAKMEAFINVHSKVRNLTERDRDCLKAADGFRIKIVGAEARQVQIHARSINSVISEAEGLPPEKAAELYESLVQLYVDDDWGERDDHRIELLTKVQELYKTAKAAPKVEKETTPAPVE